MKLPQYKQLQNQLKEQILAGVYQKGDLLPSENELSNLHKITRVTVRQALHELVKEGYIYKQKGKGSIVCAEQNTLGLLSFQGFTEVVGATNHLPTAHFIKPPYLTAWADDFFYPLSKSEKAAGCICIERLRQVDTDPVMLEYTFIPNLRLPDFCNQPFIRGSLFNTLHTRYHIEVTGMEQHIRAIPAEAPVASHLKLQEGSPVLHIYRKYETSRTGFSLYSSLFCNTEKYRIG